MKKAKNISKKPPCCEGCGTPMLLESYYYLGRWIGYYSVKCLCNYVKAV